MRFIPTIFLRYLICLVSACFFYNSLVCVRTIDTVQEQREYLDTWFLNARYDADVATSEIIKKAREYVGLYIIELDTCTDACLFFNRLREFDKAFFDGCAYDGETACMDEELHREFLSKITSLVRSDGQVDSSSYSNIVADLEAMITKRLFHLVKRELDKRYIYLFLLGSRLEGSLDFSNCDHGFCIAGYLPEDLVGIESESLVQSIARYFGSIEYDVTQRGVCFLDEDIRSFEDFCRSYQSDQHQGFPHIAPSQSPVSHDPSSTPVASLERSSTVKKFKQQRDLLSAKKPALFLEKALNDKIEAFNKKVLAFKDLINRSGRDVDACFSITPLYQDLMSSKRELEVVHKRYALVAGESKPPVVRELFVDQDDIQHVKPFVVKTLVEFGLVEFDVEQELLPLLSIEHDVSFGSKVLVDFLKKDPYCMKSLLREKASGSLVYDLARLRWLFAGGGMLFFGVAYSMLLKSYRYHCSCGNDCTFRSFCSDLSLVRSSLDQVYFRGAARFLVASSLGCLSLVMFVAGCSSHAAYKSIL